MRKLRLETKLFFQETLRNNKFGLLLVMEWVVNVLIGFDENGYIKGN